jgi:hypothetical protein
MKTIIAGGRDINAITLVVQAIQDSGFGPDTTEVVSGGAPGIDTLGEVRAALSGMPVKRFPADWKKYGRSAGPIRNRAMAEYADRLLAVWDGQSRGTKNMIDEMTKLGKPVFVFLVKRDDPTAYAPGEEIPWVKQ